MSLLSEVEAKATFPSTTPTNSSRRAPRQDRRSAGGGALQSLADRIRCHELQAGSGVLREPEQMSIARTHCRAAATGSLESPVAMSRPGRDDLGRAQLVPADRDVLFARRTLLTRARSLLSPARVDVLDLDVLALERVAVDAPAVPGGARSRSGPGRDDKRDSGSERNDQLGRTANVVPHCVPPPSSEEVVAGIYESLCSLRRAESLTPGCCIEPGTLGVYVKSGGGDVRIHTLY